MSEDETMYAYLAGAIDIDGRIIIIRTSGFRLTDARMMYYYVAIVALSDSSPLVPDLLQSIFPARRLQYSAKGRKQKEWHMWEARNLKAREPLVRFSPYLKLKRRQAELAISLINLIEQDAAGGAARPLTDEQDEARRLIYEEAEILNASRPQRTYR
jgi:hypothetical protein